MIALEWKWLRWMTSVRAQIDTVEVGDERLCSNRHGGGGAVWAPMATMEVGDKCLGLI